MSTIDILLALRVEYCRTHARVERYREERILVTEEMRRVLAYHKWKAAWWRDRRDARASGNDLTDIGVRSYAEKQAYIWERMAYKFAGLWRPVLQDEVINLWPVEFLK